MTKARVDELLTLPLEERIEIAERLWLSIDEEAEAAPLPEWQRKILDERLRDAEANPDDWVSWEEAKAKIRAGLAEKKPG